MAQDKTFRSAYSEGVAAILEATTRRAQVAAGEAVVTLQTIMTDTNEPAGVRTQAADKVLTHALRLGERLDVEQRLTELELLTKEVVHGN